MTNWILILTLYNYDIFSNGQSMTSNIESIQGFKTQSACMTAANAWLKQNTRFDHIKALCVSDK